MPQTNEPACEFLLHIDVCTKEGIVTVEGEKERLTYL